MRKLFVSIAAVVFAVPFMASTACSSGGGADCSSKACPNDPAPTQQQIDQCNASKTKSDKCSGQCSSYTSCLNTHRADICGTDGKTDPSKAVTLVTVTCKPSNECTTCLSM